MTKTNRRSFLKTSASLGGLAVAGSTLAAPALAQARTLRVGSYGGYFEDSFKSFVYPAFTEATGIEIESVTQPNSSDWLITMQQAAGSGNAPTDVSLFARDALIKASRIGGLLAPLDPKNMPASSNLDDYFVYEDTTGVIGVGAMSWFSSMVINPFFEGEATFATNDGIVALVEKASELKANTALWWSAESQMEQAMKNGDVIGGMYYHDVSQLMAADGFPIKSLFPKEGNPQGYGSWVLSPLSEKSAEAEAFINFSSDPATQALMSRNIGTAPLVAKEKTDLAIQPAYEAYLDNETFIKETWEKMLGSA